MARLKTLALLLTLTLAAGGCATTSTITRTYTDEQGRQVTETQEITDEYAYMQAQKDARKPTLEIIAADNDQPMVFNNVKALRVYSGDANGIKQYVHPGWNVLSQYGGVAGAILGAGVSGYFANELAATVGAAAGTRYVSSFNASGDQSLAGYGPGDGSILRLDPTTTTTTDRHDVTTTAEPEAQ